MMESGEEAIVISDDEEEQEEDDDDDIQIIENIRNGSSSNNTITLQHRLLVNEGGAGGSAAAVPPPSAPPADDIIGDDNVIDLTGIDFSALLKNAQQAVRMLEADCQPNAGDGGLEAFIELNHAALVSDDDDVILLPPLPAHKRDQVKQGEKEEKEEGEDRNHGNAMAVVVHVKEKVKAEHELESDNLTVSPRNDLIKFNDKSAHINMNIPESFNKDGEGVPLPSSSSSSAPVINASNAMPDNGAAEDLHDLDGNFLLAAASALTALEKSDISPKHSHPVISPENNVVTTNDRVVMSQGEDGNSGLTLSLSSPEISPLKHAAASSSSSSSSPLKQSKTPHTPSRIVNDTQTIINNNHNTCIPIASPSNHSKRLQQQSLRTRHPSPYRLDTTIESILSLQQHLHELDANSSVGDDRGFINNHDLMEEEEEQDENANRKEYSADIRGNMASGSNSNNSVVAKQLFVSDVDKYCNDTDTVATDNNNYENDDGDEMDEGVYDRPANGIFPTTAAAPVEGAVRSNSGLIVEEEEEDEEAVDGAVRGFKLSQNEFISTIIAPTDNSDAESYDSDIIQSITVKRTAGKKRKRIKSDDEESSKESSTGAEGDEEKEDEGWQQKQQQKERQKMNKKQDSLKLKSKRFFRKKELIDPDSEQEEEDGDSNVGIDEDGNGNNNEIGLGTAAVIRSTQVSSEIGKKQLDKKRSGQMMHESDNGRKEGDLGGVQGEDADDDSNEEDLDEEGEANPGVSDYDDIHLLISQQTRRVRNGGGRRRLHPKRKRTTKRSYVESSDSSSNGSRSRRGSDGDSSDNEQGDARNEQTGDHPESSTHPESTINLEYDPKTRIVKRQPFDKIHGINDLYIPRPLRTKTWPGVSPETLYSANDDSEDDPILIDQLSKFSTRLAQLQKKHGIEL